MKIGNKPVKIFEIRNRKGYVAICDDCLTEGATREEAFDRMVKAVSRMERKLKAR